MTSPQPFRSLPPAFVIRAAIGLRRAFTWLADAVVPADVVLFERSIGAAMTAMLGAAARHGIADLLVAGPATAADLAARAGLHADTLHRMLRALAFAGVFELDAAGRFSNNRRSRALLADRPTRPRDFATYFASASNLAAWADFERTLAGGGNGFERVHGLSVWEWFDAHPDERETFAHAMMGLTVGHAPIVAALYPFAEVRRLCDVGGGRGTLLSELLIRHPHLRGVLCDAAGVIESARSLLARRGVAERVETVAGSFFDGVPAGCDAYLLKNILHDWDDARCVQILRACRKAMQPGHKLLIVESLIERNQVDLAALSDVQMMMVCSDGRERGRADFERLLLESGFKAGRVFAGPLISVIEGIAV